MLAVKSWWQRSVASALHIAHLERQLQACKSSDTGVCWDIFTKTYLGGNFTIEHDASQFHYMLQILCSCMPVPMVKKHICHVSDCSESCNAPQKRRWLHFGLSVPYQKAINAAMTELNRGQTEGECGSRILCEPSLLAAECTFQLFSLPRHSRCVASYLLWEEFCISLDLGLDKFRPMKTMKTNQLHIHLGS